MGARRFFFLSFLKRSLVNTHAHTPRIDRLLLSDSSQFEITFFLLFQSNPFGWDSFSFLFFFSYIIICDLIVDKGGKKEKRWLSVHELGDVISVTDRADVFKQGVEDNMPPLSISIFYIQSFLFCVLLSLILSFSTFLGDFSFFFHPDKLNLMRHPPLLKR